MEKLVLIDGNSLLNRAFYAMRVFTTKDGLPTNGVFGFIKLMFKIIEDEKPAYLAIAFDVHAPTFRHKLYADYKGTRKAMPEELVVQVPVLKDLLRSMNICVVEKEGFEADDLFGTLSRSFRDVSVLIYTGDRDAYQLVNENVTVCFTKRGVSETERLTAENFQEKLGLSPAQIIEEKALMGDSSDNIPGVKGIGPKFALELLQAYGTIDGVYENLDKLSPSYRQKLENGRESAYLSHTLATINTAVPLDIRLEDCRLCIPFPEEARSACARLEFRTLVDSDFFAKERTSEIETTECSDIPAFLRDCESAEEFACSFESEGVHISFGRKEYVFPLRVNLLSSGFYFDELKPVLEFVFNGKKRVYVADIKAICHKLDEIGVAVTCPVEDVSLLRYLSDSNRRPSGAKGIAQDYALPERNCAYGLFLAYRDAAEKTAGTEEETLYRTLELPLADILLDMERTGVRVDESRFPEFAEKYNREIDDLSKRIFELAGVDSFNLKSPFQLSALLFDKLGYDARGIKKNIRGGYSTSAEVLEKLAEEHEIARLVLRYREIQKLQSTYIDGIRPLVENGIVHTTYNQMMTTTGRLSSANPNLQNIPVRKDEGRELRKLFIAREGNVLVDADYSQIELRLLAHFSGCKPLIEAYNHGKDIHATTAAQVFGVSLNEVTSEMRRRAKAVNFGIIYGISAFGLAKDLGCTTTEAQTYINQYFATYTDVKEYMDENVARAKKDGYVTTILGRKRYIPELKSANYTSRSFGERAAMNMPLQGSSADIIKLAMLGVSRRLKREGLRSAMVLQVHDELVLDAPVDEAETAAKILKEEMESAAELNVPLIAEVSTGHSWYDAK